MAEKQNIFTRLFTRKPKQETQRQTHPEMKLSSKFGTFGAVGHGGFMPAGYYGNAYVLTFDGEKDAGSMGTPIEYIVDYGSLATRSRQIYLENGIAQTILDKYTMWIIGKGLKFQAQPIAELLSIHHKRKMDTTKKHIELMFDIWSGSRASSYNSESNLHWIANEVYKNMKISGDCLVILRYDKKIKNVTVQAVDGQRVCGNTFQTNPSTGNEVDNGVEITKSAKVVAYHIKKPDGSYQRIKAFEPQTGLRQAFLVHSSKYRISSVRGLPAIAQTMETLTAIDRYKEATIGSAEERQKIALQVVHQLNADGTSPFTQGLAQSLNADESDVAQYPSYSDGAQTAQTVQATTNKTTVNMPVGSELKQLESKNELHFKEFYESNAYLICSAMGIPPNVAFSMYNDSYSASRASIKDWEHTMRVQRSRFHFEFYQPIYEFWLHINVLLNRIDLSGYWDAFIAKDEIKLTAFRRSRFFGANMPHIDPNKEVQAVRAKLGDLAKDIPLMSIEEAVETLSGGDADANMEKFAKEKEFAENLGLKAETTTNNSNNGSNS